MQKWIRTLAVAAMTAIGAAPLAAQDVALNQVLAQGETWSLVAEGYQSLEGIAADRQGAVYFADKAANKIFKVDFQGAITTFAENSGGAQGLMFGPDDRLYAAQSRAKRIVAYAADGATTTIAENTPVDDLVVAGDGSIWFTDVVGDKIGYISPDRATIRIVKDNVRPNGLALAHREGTLVVTDAQQPQMWAYRIELDGSLTAAAPAFAPLRIPFGEVFPGSDGMTVDTLDRVFVATTAGVQMFDTEDRISGVIDSPVRGEKITSATFGGEDFAYLYVTVDHQLYRLRTATTGIPYFARDYDQIGRRGRGRTGGGGRGPGRAGGRGRQ